jgi:hypothetical protein
MPHPPVDVGVRHLSQELADTAWLTLKVVGHRANIHPVRIVSEQRAQRSRGVGSHSSCLLSDGLVFGCARLWMLKAL